jgi:hypothetical protein
VGLLRSREGGGEVALRTKAPVAGSGAGHGLVLSAGRTQGRGGSLSKPILLPSEKPS